MNIKRLEGESDNELYLRQVRCNLELARKYTNRAIFCIVLGLILTIVNVAVFVAQVLHRL